MRRELRSAKKVNVEVPWMGDESVHTQKVRAGESERTDTGAHREAFLCCGERRDVMI